MVQPRTGAAGIREGEPGQIDTRADGSILVADGWVEDWFGRPAPALVGMRFASLLTPTSRMLYQTRCLPMLWLQGSVTGSAFELLRPDGSRQPVRVSARVRCGAVPSVPGDDGRRVAITVFAVAEAPVAGAPAAVSGWRSRPARPRPAAGGRC